jgi:transposase-like protein
MKCNTASFVDRQAASGYHGINGTHVRPAKDGTGNVRSFDGQRVIVGFWPKGAARRRIVSDTLQVVTWALEQECQFRRGESWQTPDRTTEQLSDLRVVSRALVDGRAIDGVCVTGFSCERHDLLNPHDVENHIGVPVSGFGIPDRLGSYGSIDSAQATCQECEANVSRDPQRELVGCHGHIFFIQPDSDELEKSLRNAARQLGLQAALTTAFLPTSPLWYGFWAQSPLRKDQVDVLAPLFSHTFTDEDQECSGIDHFLRALNATVRLNIPLHVSLAPSGHIDLGWCTEFPHCPRCKANAPVEHWQEQYSRDEHTCEVCGYAFIPDDTYSRTEVKDVLDRDADSLERLLGPEKYPEFVRRSIFAQRRAKRWQRRQQRRRRANR